MSRKRTGIVYLVGAGPGDPGLLTLRGEDVLRQADVVIHDAGVDPGIVNLAPASAERIVVGIGRENLSLAQVCELLVARARRGRIVVRLRIGDPYISGRGSEEALHCVSQGVHFELIPGVEGAFAAPGFAGIPLLQAALSGSLLVIRGPFLDSSQAPTELDEPKPAARRPGVSIRRSHKHGASATPLRVGPPATNEAPPEDAIDVDWPAVCRAADTLVFLRAEAQIDFLRRGLLLGGRSDGEPIAAISAGACGSRTAIVSTVGEMGKDFDPHLLPSPVVFVLGDVVNLRQALDVSHQSGISGLRLGLVTSRHWPGAWTRPLLEAGIVLTEYPVSVHHPNQGLREELGMLADDLRRADHVLFTSENAVRIFARELNAARMDWRLFSEACEIVAHGPGAGRALSDFHIACRVTDQTHAPRHLARHLPDQLNGRHVLIFCESLCDPVAIQELRDRGATVMEIPLCEAAPSREAVQHLYRDAVEDPRLDVLLVDTPRAVEALALAIPPAELTRLSGAAAVLSFDESTTHALMERGITPCMEPGQPEPDGVVKVLVDWKRDPASVSLDISLLQEEEEW